jgi:enoyl-CoA hydratase/carnithine racemase
MRMRLDLCPVFASRAHPCIRACSRLQEAKALGLVDELVPKDQLLSAAETVMLKVGSP